MLYLVDSRLPAAVTRQQFIEFATSTPPSHAWELVRSGVLTQFAYKTGDEPGVVGFVEADSLEEAQGIVAGLPVAAGGMLDFEIDPVNPLARF